MQGGQIIIGGLAVLALCSQAQVALIQDAAAQTRQSSDVIIVVNNSASMSSAIRKIEHVLNGFANTIKGKMDLHIIMISDSRGHSSSGICVPAPLGSGMCPNDDNGFPYRHISTNLGPQESFTRTLFTYNQWKGVLRPEASKTIIVVDDGLGSSAAEFNASLRRLDPTFQNYKFYAVAKGPLCGPPSTGNEYTKLAALNKGMSVDICGDNFGPGFDAMAAAIIGANPPQPAAIRHVSPTGTDNSDCSMNACFHIQFAINQAAAGDTVQVAAGTYLENIALKTGVHVLSAQGAMIQGSSVPASAWAVQAVQTGPGTILEGFVVICSGLNPCGGVLIKDGTAEVRRNDIRNNTNQYVGGGIEIVNSSAVVVNNLIRNNKSMIAGGGIAVLDSPSAVRIVNNTFFSNSAGGPIPNAGHIYLAQSENVLLQNNIFSGFVGGAPAVVASTMTSPPALKNNLFTSGLIYQDEAGIVTDPLALNNRTFAANNVVASDLEIFASPGTNFHLHPAWAHARDKGLGENAPPNDFDGDVRPLGVGVEIGFDETQSNGGGVTQCSDGFDNDGDNLIDRADSGCADSSDNDESNSCVSTVSTVAGLQVEVNGVNTSPHSRQTLTRTLRSVSAALARGDREKARVQLAGFVREAVQFSNLKGNLANRIPVDQASRLVCGAANVLTTIALP